MTSKVSDGEGKELGSIEIDVTDYPDGAPAELWIHFDGGATAVYILDEIQD